MSRWAVVKVSDDSWFMFGKTASPSQASMMLLIIFYCCLCFLFRVLSPSVSEMCAKNAELLLCVCEADHKNWKIPLAEEISVLRNVLLFSCSLCFSRIVYLRAFLIALLTACLAHPRPEFSGTFLNHFRAVLLAKSWWTYQLHCCQTFRLPAIVMRIMGRKENREIPTAPAWQVANAIVALREKLDSVNCINFEYFFFIYSKTT